MVLRTLCLVCKKKNVSMTNKVVVNKSSCSVCLNDKSRFMKQKNNKKCVG